MTMLSRSPVRFARRSAFTLIEFLVAMTLTIGVLAAGSLAMASSERALTGVRELDQATRIGYEVLEKVRTFGCGVAVNAATATAADRACAAQSPSTPNPTGAFKDWTLKAGSPSMAGDFVIERRVDLRPAEEQAADPTAPDASKQVFTVTVRSVWVQPGQSASDCHTTSTSSLLATAEVRQPSMIRRIVTIESDGPEGVQAVTLSALESVPTGVAYAAQGNGSALVSLTSSRVNELVPVTFAAADGSWSVTRFWKSGECSQLWFPFLAPTDYRAGAGLVVSGSPARVNAEQIPIVIPVSG